MFSPLVRKLEHGVGLTAADHDRLISLARTRRVDTRRQIIEQGDQAESVHLVLEGFACRYKVLHNGKRQITALLVPGDFCDLQAAVLGTVDYGIATLSPCIIAEFPRTPLFDLIENHPRLARALWWLTSVEEAILNEWLVNMGQREAHHQLAHLFCELLVRLQIAGFGDANGYYFPLVQGEIADVLGITPVHVNRTLNNMRDSGLITLQKRRIIIHDVGRLKAYCDFNPDYLHLMK